MKRRTKKIRSGLKQSMVILILNYLKKHLITGQILYTSQKRNISIPKNCIFRISAPLVDGFLNSKVFNNTSSVITDSKKAQGKICPSFKQGGQCLDCRACWNFKETNINYLIH